MRHVKNGSWTAELACGHRARITVDPYGGGWTCTCGGPGSYVARRDWQWEPNVKGEEPEFD